MAFLSALGQTAPGSLPGNQTTTGYGAATQGAQQGIINALQQYFGASGQQTNLAQQLQAVANGQGPNPSQQAFVNATQANNQAGASAIASQRGLNPGLAARQIQAATAGNNQAAAGQAAELEQQEQLGALGAEGNVLAQQATEGNQLFSAEANAQNAQNQGALGQQTLAQGAYQNNINDAASLLGAGASAAGTLSASALKAAPAAAHGGEVGELPGDFGRHYSAATGMHPLQAAVHEEHVMRGLAEGGELTAEERDKLPDSAFALPGRRYPIHDESHARNALARVAQHGTPAEKAEVEAKVHRRYPAIGKAAGGETTTEEVRVSPGELELLPDGTRRTVPGRAQVAGDSPKNDTVTEDLPKGTKIVPRSSAGSEEKTQAFIEALDRRMKARRAA